jgi:transmembrane sensor
MKINLPWSLIVSKLRQDLSDKDEASFNSWLELDNNSELFLQLEQVWVNVQKKTAAYEPDVEYYWNELFAHMQDEQSENSKTNSLSKHSHYIPLKRFYRFVAAASILLVLTFSGAYYLGNNQSTTQSPLTTQSYSSLTGKSRVVLPDGTEVWLHTNTTLSYNSDFKSNSRKVTIKGEAYFNVTHDAHKPFIVNANGVSVLVHGTKFNVYSYASSDNVLVSLLEGSVSMKASDKTIALKPGEEGCFNKTNNSLTSSEGDVDYAKSWTEDKLQFENKSLRYVCRYLSKWYSVDITIDDRIPDNQSYTFTVRDEALEEVVRIMARINSLDYQFDKQNQLFLKQKHRNTETRVLTHKNRKPM